MSFLAALGTAFYMWRLYFLVFGGNERSEEAKHAHESPLFEVGAEFVLGQRDGVGQGREVVQEPAGGPNFYAFAEGVRYDINISNDGDADPEIIYRWRFQDHYRNPNTFLYNTGPINNISDTTWNRPQFYTVTRIKNGVSKVLGSNLPMWRIAAEIVRIHPFLDGNGRVGRALVHGVLKRAGLIDNGVIENYSSLRSHLQERGYVFRSQTDTEVIAHLVSSCLDRADLAATNGSDTHEKLVQAVRAALPVGASPRRRGR